MSWTKHCRRVFFMVTRLEKATFVAPRARARGAAPGGRTLELQAMVADEGLNGAARPHYCTGQAAEHGWNGEHTTEESRYLSNSVLKIERKADLAGPNDTLSKACDTYTALTLVQLLQQPFSESRI
ncbi:hypothetical protein R1sor_014321 [Riccia sorocarpa]|uniref:Uncharacterized protein n=1 Tax=Riccia sorocarpa TaxID=122646 RepID=A0ABD3HBM2_9MARC